MNKENHVSALVKNIAVNDCEKSFRLFYDHFYPRLFEIAIFYTKNQWLAEEVVSDVFVKVWNQRKSLINIHRIPDYLFIAVKRTCLNSLRNSKAQPVFVYDLECQILVEAQTPEDHLFGEDVLKCISQTVEHLPEKCRLVYKLIKEDGLKYKEAADLLNLSEKTVEMQIGKALKKIRHDLEQLNKESHPSPIKLKSGFLVGLIISFLFS